MESITIDKAKEKKLRLQSDIADLMARFSEETGLRVVSVDIHNDYEYGRNVYRYRAEVEVTL